MSAATCLPSRTLKTVRSVADAHSGDFSIDALLAAQEPVIFRGLARDWSMVAAGQQGDAAARAYLRRFEGSRPVVAYAAEPEAGGRFFYDAALAGLNFTAERLSLSSFLDRVAAHADDDAPPALYMGSTDLDLYLPGFRTENDLALPPPPDGYDAPLASIWVGNRTIAATHYDMSNNLACCLVGTRRFTLFPPDQIENLYPGPLEPTPGGQVVSMVDLRDPDLERFPRFEAALAAASIADLEPGDVLFYPALWWHNVEALGAFNVMVNYWWNDAPAHLDTPMTTLMHALLSLRDRPAAEKRAWSAVFDYYVWGDAARPAAHLPPTARGDLAPIDVRGARRLRARLLERMNR